MSDETVLRRQRQRGMALREHLRKIGDREYDPDAALLRQFSAFFPRFVGHTVGQGSLEYALLLLLSDDRLYGTDDAAEANRIIRKILEYQDLEPGSKTYGNFLWMTHWDRVKDANAVSFLASGLVQAYLTFPDKLEDGAKKALEDAFPNVLQGIRNHKVSWQYTNIFFLNLGGLVSLAKVLDDPSAHEEAVRDFDTWLAGTSEDGFHEFNSPTYTPVTLFGMETAWANTPDREFRARLGRTMDLIAYQLALNLFPNGFLGGGAARAYQGDVLRGNGWASVYAHLKFGTPHCSLPAIGEEITDRVMFANLTLHDYVPPAAARELAVQKPDYAEIHDRAPSLHSRRTHIMTPRYSLSSQSLDWTGGHSPPAYVLLVRDAPGLRRSTVALPDESFTRLPCALFRCRQTGSRVVGRLHYDLAEEQRERFLEDPGFVCEPRILFGPREQVQDVQIGNVDWGGGPVTLLPGQPVAVSYGDLFVGVLVQPLDHTGGPATDRTTLAYGEDDELRLGLRLFGGPELGPEDKPIRALLLFDVRTGGDGECLGEYAESLASWELTDRSDSAEVVFSATHPQEGTLTYPYSETDPDPIGDALHISPGLELFPGDLLQLVNGEIDLDLRMTC